MLIGMGNTSPSAPERHLLDGKGLEDRMPCLKLPPPQGLHDKEYLIQLLEFNNLHPTLLWQTRLSKGLFKVLLSQPVRLKLNPEEINLWCFRRRFHCGRGSKYNHADGKDLVLDFRYWGETKQRPEPRSQLALPSLNLIPSTKGKNHKPAFQPKTSALQKNP